jgi:hypothetical protein
MQLPDEQGKEPIVRKVIMIVQTSPLCFHRSQLARGFTFAKGTRLSDNPPTPPSPIPAPFRSHTNISKQSFYLRLSKRTSQFININSTVNSDALCLVKASRLPFDIAEEVWPHTHTHTHTHTHKHTRCRQRIMPAQLFQLHIKSTDAAQID